MTDINWDKVGEVVKDLSDDEMLEVVDEIMSSVYDNNKLFEFVKTLYHELKEES